MSQQISSASLLTRDALSTISIPEEALSKLTDTTDNFLVIFIPRSDNLKISIIPCKSSEILKILVHLTEFSPQTVKSIAEIIYDLKISTVHTSGICFHDLECCYEAYVEIQEKKNDLKFIREKFLKIPQCKAVDLEIISTQ
jgi:hypothetical protein